MPIKKNSFDHGDIIRLIDMLSFNYIDYNELKLDKENNFQMNVTENNAVDIVEFFAGEDYLVSTCSLKPKKENHIKKMG